MLVQIQRFRTLVSESKEWKPEQKQELFKFLRGQAASWKLLGDEYWKTGLGRAKETMLFATWKNFTMGMTNPPGRKVMNKVVPTATMEPAKSKKKRTKAEIRKQMARKTFVKKIRGAKSVGGKVVLKKSASKETLAKNVGRKKDVTLEREPSISGTIVQSDVKTIKGGIETPIGSKKPVGQTIVHPKSKSKAAKKDVKHKIVK